MTPPVACPVASCPGGRSSRPGADSRPEAAATLSPLGAAL